MRTAIELSKYIVSKCVMDQHPISNLQLQKILYYIQKDFLSRGQTAFDDPIEAWQFGPVVPTVYYNFCGFGAMKITSKYDSINFLLCEEDRSSIHAIVEQKRLLNPWEMVEETHKVGSAWAQAYNNGQGNHTVIPNALIQSAG